MNASPVSLDTKRHLGEIAGEDAHDDKKQHTKPGRKPIATEAKSKRTAQNRAAQRAYRERKERKMKDLEDQVLLLEDDKIRANTEADILKAQIDVLKSELSRYRGHSDFSDLSLPRLPTTEFKPIGNSVRSHAKDEDRSPEWMQRQKSWSKTSSTASDDYTNSSNQVPDLVSGSSNNTSPLNENVMISPDSNASDIYPPGKRESQFQQDMFEEQLNPFCASLGEACGSKTMPIPKYKRDSQQFPPANNAGAKDSPFHSLFTPNLDLSDPFFNDQTASAFNPDFGEGENSLAFLNDVNFDASLALGNVSNDPVSKSAEEIPTADPLAGLINEESAYDHLNLVNIDFNFNEFVKSSYSASESSRNNSVADGSKAESSITSFNSPVIHEETEKQIKEAEEDEVVPAPETTLKCSEIWERITSHPRYTDIDIDGLCSELKLKAKCSEKGVVIAENDVHHLLERSAKK